MHLLASLLLITSTVSAGVPVELQPTEGDPRQVLLDQVDAEQLIVRSEVTAPPETIPANTVRQIRWTTAPTETKPAPFQIRLTDGSLVAAESYSAANGTAQVVWNGSPTAVAIPVDRIRAVRLGRFDQAIDQSWQELLGRPVVADVVGVLRKNQTLDNVQGVIQDVTDEVVKFQFEGETIDVRRSKVVGISYYRPQANPAPPERGTLMLHDGSVLRVEQLALAESSQGLTARVQTVSGAELTVPMSLFKQLDLAGQSLTYLTQLEPESEIFTPFVDQPKLTETLARWYAVRTSSQKAIDPVQLKKDGRLQSLDNSVSLHSRTELVYRLAGQYRRFHGLAGIDPTLGIGRAQLTIRADGANKMQQNLVAGDDAVPMSIDVTGVNRLVVTVDYGEDSDIADNVILGDARLIK